VHVPYRTAAVSLFRPILGKYIPGKVWFLLGTAGLLTENGVPLSQSSFIVAIFQLVLVCSGLLLGSLALFAFSFPILSTPVGIALVPVCMLVLVFFAKPRKLPAWLQRILRRSQQSSDAWRELPPVVDVFFFALIHWVVVGLSFLAFFRAISVDAGATPVFIQPLAINIGVVAVFVPGGIGVREGVMVGYLTLAGLTAETALAASVAARFWFLAGEIIAFLIGVLTPGLPFPSRATPTDAPPEPGRRPDTDKPPR
jgi:uncharacterized membrane protein YbhN (UPF0104 family)